jgi:hypothetical protein
VRGGWCPGREPRYGFSRSALSSNPSASILSNGASTVIAGFLKCSRMFRMADASADFASRLSGSRIVDGKSFKFSNCEAV